VSISREIGYLEGVAWGTHELGSVMLGDPSAAGLLCESLTTHVQLGDAWRTASVLETIASRLLAKTDPALAVQLLAAADALRQRLAAPVPPVERPMIDEALAILRTDLGSEGFASAWAAGLSVHLVQAVELATVACSTATTPVTGSQEVMDSYDDPVSSAGASDASKVLGLSHELTEREIEVLQLLSDGLTNREIAGRLYISTGTAGVHVSNILRKLGVRSRVQAATMFHRPGPPK
jgi:DNA-binding CsgD family transcriptional regulator